MQDVSYVKVLDTTSENEKKNGILCAYKLAHRMNVWFTSWATQKSQKLNS